jgi:large subunit ribosomal protein L17
MRHRVAHRKLGRVSAHRIALLRNLATALFDKERIRTTLPKARELRPFAERLITLSKREDDRLHARRLVLRDIQDKAVLKKLFDDLGARFASRPGGYTRILKLGPRRSDGAEMAIVELIGSNLKLKSDEPSEAKGKDEKAKAEAKPEAEAPKKKARPRKKKVAKEEAASE